LSHRPKYGGLTVARIIHFKFIALQVFSRGGTMGWRGANERAVVSYETWGAACSPNAAVCSPNSSRFARSAPQAHMCAPQARLIWGAHRAAPGHSRAIRVFVELWHGGLGRFISHPLLHYSAATALCPALSRLDTTAPIPQNQQLMTRHHYEVAC
jgi:hypothetical protein